MRFVPNHKLFRLIFFQEVVNELQLINRHFDLTVSWRRTNLVKKV